MPNQSPFYIGEYFGFISKRGYLTPLTYQKLSEKFKDKDSLEHIESILRDGSNEIGKLTSFGSDHKDIFFFAGYMDVTNPLEKVAVIVAEEEHNEFIKCISENGTDILDEVYKTTGSQDVSFEIIKDNDFFRTVKERDRGFANHIDSCFSGTY